VPTSRFTRLAAGGLALVFLGTVLAAVPSSAAPSPEFDAIIRRDGFGVPHILADDFPSLGFGIGYAFAEDNICTLMDYTVTVSGERSKWFGPEGTWTFGGNGTTNKNLDSDFYYASVNESGVLEELLAQPAPHGPLPEVRESVRGYAAGINRYLEHVGGAGGIEDPRCQGAGWVRPLTEQDVYRRFFQLATMASSGVAITGIAGAQPPIAGVVPSIPGVTDGLTAEQLSAVAELPARFNEALGIGSNAYGLGREATDNGMGMVLGNPHFPWQGGERLYQMHLTIPGRVNVSGAGLYGVPLVLIGHTDGVAWSHTVSTAFRFTPFELTLAPGDPTSYLVDGVPEPMTSRKLTVEVRRPDGSVGTEERMLWSTRYGPMLNSLLGLPLFPWTPVKAFALRDANVQVRYLNQFFLWDQAQSVDELFDIQKEYLSVPWVNTIAADRSGRALYSDVSVVPNVPDAKATACSGVLGLVTFTALGLPTLDGSRRACDWDTDPDAVVPGIFGPANLPHVVRDDYVTNSNDSFWLSNPEQPLEGFARIVGDQRTDRSLRTRLGLLMVQERLAGTDQYDPPAGNVFTQDILQDVVFNNRQYAGELVRDDLVTLCRSLGGTAPTTAPGTVPLANACDVLAGWDLRDDLDSSGAVLFRRFWTNLVASPLPLDVPGIVVDHLPPELLPLLPDSLAVATGVPWLVPFDPADAVGTPRQLDTANPRVALALGDAVTDMNGAGIPLDAGLRGWQYEVKDGTAYPVHGGPGGFGVFNAISAPWHGTAGPQAGYSDIVHGSSFVMAAHFVDPATNDGCGVDADAIVTYSQSEDVTRPFFANQTAMYGEKEWNPMYFCEAELAADPGLVRLPVSSRPAGLAELPATGWAGGSLGPWLLALGLAGVVAARRVGRVRPRP
jgi:acyl-homoserine-lactone acylase